MIYYVNVGENHHTICSQKSMKHRGYRGGAFDTFKNPFEPTITHQKPLKISQVSSPTMQSHIKSCKVHRCPQ